MKHHNKEKKLARRQEAFKNVGSDPRGLGKTTPQGFRKPGSLNGKRG